MCGIAGVRRIDGGPVDEALLRAMSDTLAHRGPDDEGSWTAPGVGFGHRRLSIIDLAGSPQPMASADGRVHVCFNGEIFNYRELRRSLRYPFRTEGDTETLLATFLAHGPEGVTTLNGQFAYAIFDERDGSLWLFRDRLGVLPLYYAFDGDTFVFGSEVKALLPALERTPPVDLDSVADYLAHRAVPAPNTLFQGVRKLPAGHWLRLTAAGQLSVHRYWSLPDEERPASDAEAVVRVESALRDAVDAALVADVPVGAYLSGGLDSSLIVALMSRARDGAGIETFAAGFGDPRFDELPYARRVSELLGTRHHEVRVTPEDFRERWHELSWHRDAPVSEPADVAVSRLAALARQHVKVVLSGEGSDELFAGYPKYRFARVGALADLVPSGPRGAALTALERALPSTANRPRTMLRALAAASPAERARMWFASFTAEERRRLLPQGQGHGVHEALWAAASGDQVRRMLHVDAHAWLSDTLLERGDRMSMSASLELRPPFLDHRLVELAFRLPTRVKVRAGTTKWVVKEIARRHLPSEIVDRRKVGFRVPLDDWFRGGLREMAWDMLLSQQSFVGETFDRPTVRALLESHDAGRRNEEVRLWTLLCLEVWHDVFYRQRAAAPVGR